MTRAFISVGSNVRPAENVREALCRLALQARITGISTVYQTAAEGRPEDPPYYNCVVEVATEMPPLELKRKVLRPIEEALGRERTADKYASRTIDLDLILYGEAVLAAAELTLPDPQILRRPFVALPLLELFPGATLPGSGLRMEEVAGKVSGEGMKALEDYSETLRKEIGYDGKCRESRAPGEGTPGRDR